MNAIKKPARFVNTLYTADNLYVLKGLNSESVDLIYLDPPFNSKRFYAAPIGSRAAGVGFKDIWHWEDVDEACLEELAAKYPALAHYIDDVGDLHSEAMKAYLTYMAQRFVELHRVLKDTGSLYLHCDPTASHYLKGLLDGLFGRRNFVNEIIWHYQTGGVSKRRFARKHDTILFYAKSNGYIFSPDAIRVPRTAKSLQRIAHPRGARTTILDKFPEDVFDIPAINAMDKERVGYPTQKPLALLRRIILASSNEGDVVLDPFCGCATTCVAAQQLGRKWIGIDIEDKAVDLLVQRLSDDAGLFKDFLPTTILPQRTDVEYISPAYAAVKERLYKQQGGICNGCRKPFEPVNLQIDHIVPKARGGGDYFENYQLLCGHCNLLKGTNTMEYLRMKLAALQKVRSHNYFTR